MLRVRTDNKFIGWLKPNGGPEVADRERDGAAEVDVTRITEKPHTSVRPVLDANGSGIALHCHCRRRHPRRPYLA